MNTPMCELLFTTESPVSRSTIGAFHGSGKVVIIPQHEIDRERSKEQVERTTGEEAKIALIFAGEVFPTAIRRHGADWACTPAATISDPTLPWRPARTSWGNIT
jgi:hypothetical protein